MSAKPAPSVISAEVARFDALGDSWWDADGPMAPLHRLTPVRVAWARDCALRHFRREAEAGSPFAGLEILDIGCGAGLFAEPLARLGGDVLGIDPAPASIGVARRHAEETGARLAYRVAAPEEIAAEPRRFDVVSAMEVVEHVTDPARFVALAASLLKPGGLFLASTLNRTLRSFALAIIGAEYVLRWLEPGTHRWEQFVRPEEFSLAARVAGLKVIERRGVSYDPLRRTWRLSDDLSVNYLFAAKKPAQRPVASDQ
jgi:2-polyprenyl-6-hydroxyphenyl methylase / 3-demethylubiquinone-9 3-methyltransferase